MADLSPLRGRMIEDMPVCNLSPATQRSYISAVSKFSRYFGRSPDRLELEDVRACQVHLASPRVASRCWKPRIRRRTRWAKVGLRILSAMKGLTSVDLVVALMSGGGSSLMVLPADGMRSKARVVRSVS